jgi:hypothetical protein
MLGSDPYNDGVNSNQVQEVKMDEQKERSSCLLQEITYPHGSQSCKNLYWDEYCFECVDGTWRRVLK